MEGSERPHFQSPEIKLVSERTYQQYLEFFSLPEQTLKNKQILDIGSGFADFVRTVNQRFGKTGTRAIGVDPVYVFFQDDFEAFEKATQAAGLPLDFSYGTKIDAIADPEERKKARQKFYADFYREVTSSKNYLAGSHQGLPFKNESMDLVLANNSMFRYQDATIPERALKESIRVVRPDGEIRIQPVSFKFKWDPDENSLYIQTTNPPTDTDIEILEKTGKIPTDRLLFKLLREWEESGITFYLTSYLRPPRPFKKPEITEIQFQNIILRKDQQTPNVDSGQKEFHQLRRLSFLNSQDNYHIPSAVVDEAVDETETKNP